MALGAFMLAGLLVNGFPWGESTVGSLSQHRVLAEPVSLAWWSPSAATAAAIPAEPRGVVSALGTITAASISPEVAAEPLRTALSTPVSRPTDRRSTPVQDVDVATFALALLALLSLVAWRRRGQITRPT